MKRNILKGLLFVAAMATAATSQADHNGMPGPGTANMPNDIHNTRIEDDNETFMDLVQYGDGADSVNRYADDDSDTTTTTMVREPRGGMASRPSMSRMSRR